MRAQADMPRRRRRTSGRGRVLIVVAAVVLFVLFTSLRGVAGFYTDYLWFDNLGLRQVWSGILGGQGRARRHLHRDVLRALLRQPDHRRPDGTGLPPARARGRDAQPVPRPDRPSGLDRPGRRVAAVRPDRRRRRVGRVEPVDPVPQRQVVRHRRRHVQHRRGLLHLPAALLPVGRAVAVRVADHHPADHHRGRLPQRRHPAADADAAGHPAGEGPPVGAAGPPVAGQGGRLLVPALRADLLDPGLRRRRHLHRREGAAAGAQPADVHRPALVRPVHLQHLAPRLGAAGHGRRALGPGGAGGRHRLPGVRAEVPGAADRVQQGSALHRPQHRGHPPGAQHDRRQDRVPAVRSADRGHRHEQGHRGEPADGPEHPAARSRPT